MSNSTRDLEAEVTQRSKELVQLTSAWQNHKESLVAESTKLREAHESILLQQAALTALEEKLGKSQAQLEKTQSVADKEQVEADMLHKQYLAAQGGMAASGDKSLVQQIADHKKTIAARQTEVANLEMRSKHLEASVQEKRKKLQKSSAEFAKSEAAYAKGMQDLEQLGKKLRSSTYTPEGEAKLKAAIAESEQKLGELRDTADCLRAQLSQTEFNFADPAAKFDRSKVKGMVARLVSVKKPSVMTAVEVAAGARLFQVVVDTEQTGKLLLENGKLQKRVTIIPLNKVEAHCIPDKIVSAANKAVGADVALSFIGFDDELQAAMKYVFGHTLICKDIEAAKHCTFSKEIHSRSVTLEGDVLDPAGTLTGGARKPAGLVLPRLAELSDAMAKLAAAEGELQNLKAQLKEMQAAAVDWKRVKEQYDLTEHELKMQKEIMSKSQHGQLCQAIADDAAALEDATLRVKTAQDELKRLHVECVEFEKEMKDFESNVAGKTTQLQAKAKAAKSKAIEAMEKKKALEQTFQEMRLEADEVRAELKGLDESKVALEASIAEQQRKLDSEEGSVAAKRELYEAKRTELEEQKAKLRKCDKEVAELTKQKDELAKKQGAASRLVKKLEHEEAQLQKEAKEASQLLVDLEEEHAWITHEKHLFGRAGSEFDFKAKDTKTATKQLVQLQETQASLSKKINKKVMSMFEKAEQEYATHPHVRVQAAQHV
jgi:structural maintenance of chromosome 2